MSDIGLRNVSLRDSSVSGEWFERRGGGGAPWSLVCSILGFEVEVVFVLEGDIRH